MSHHELFDYDVCECCRDKPAMIGSPWMLDYCSPACRETDRLKREEDAELERIADITSGGQS